MVNPFYQVGQWLFGGLRRLVGIQYPMPAYEADAAAPVTFDTAMQLSAVWACVKLLSETPASLPLNFYRRVNGERVPVPDHPLAELFARKPNRYQTRIEFWETVFLQLELFGNSYCQITRSGDRIVSLMPLMSSQMEVRLMDDGSLTYQYQTENGSLAIFSERSIWHLKLMGNGLTGLSPLAYQRNTLGIASAAEKAVTNVYKNGAKPSGVLKLDRLLTQAQRAEARAAFATLTTGESNRLMVLEKGTEFEAISLSPQDIELLSSRKFQLSEICRWYGVPSVLVNDNNGQTTWGTGIYEIVQGFYKLTMRPLLEKCEISMQTHLLSDRDRRDIEIEFDFNALLTADYKTLVESLRSAVTGGLLTPNEARARMNESPQENGDVLYMQGAMMPIDRLGQPAAPTPAQAEERSAAVALERRFDAMQGDIQEFKARQVALMERQPAAQPITVRVGIDNEQMTKMALDVQQVANHAFLQIKQEIEQMELVVNPVIHNHIEIPEAKMVPPQVNVYNEVSPAPVTVVDSHPTRAIQTVERNGIDEITRTITTYEH
jgi:HK97 family phage portal protein